METLTVAFLDDEVPGEDMRLFGMDCSSGAKVMSGGGTELSVTSFSDPDHFLEMFSQGGDRNFHALLLDVDFSKLLTQRRSAEAQRR